MNTGFNYKLVLEESWIDVLVLSSDKKLVFLGSQRHSCVYYLPSELISGTLLYTGTLCGWLGYHDL